ncbi:hypothetical protein ACJJTC_018053 [Scirpophaga incertulas]
MAAARNRPDSPENDPSQQILLRKNRFQKEIPLDVTNTTEQERSTQEPTPPIPLRPEYAHPAGVEALDPYNSEKNHPPPHHKDYLEEDYDHETNKEDDHGTGMMQTNFHHSLNKPATLRCRAANALQVYFKCNDVRSVSSTQFEFVDPQSGVRIVEAECNVTRNQVEEYFGEDRFTCTCYAWSSRGDIRSQPAVVELACKCV